RRARSGMFSMLTTCYLFLGGTGAGALVVLSVLECANARRRAASPWGARTRFERACALPDEFFARGWPLCFVVLALGMLCLLVDLGRPDRLLGLLVSPQLSAISVGAYALVVALMCAGAFSLAALLDGVRGGPAAVYVLAGVGVVAGVVTMAYTGVLLQSLASVLFWQTPLLPLLFVLSSTSCGIACVFLSAAFVEARQPFVRPLVLLARIDGVIIVAEALCLAAYLLLASAGEGTRLAVEALVAGVQAPLLWGGIVVGGMVLPFALERFITHGNSRTQFVWIAALLLVGGFTLRFCIVGVAAWDVTQMPDMLYGLSLGLG
ncbi:NrfD/PsrC family molybdoenzyme membrane anchor subunit, partial [Gordonibacter sp.]|uniref:NrfD/PsrC family molybdoenzyme membrane anchor subunit n=2 Tax=Gordonibacter sp. TaxID=1968902 RepID=UPI002FC70F5B